MNCIVFVAERNAELVTKKAAPTRNNNARPQQERSAAIFICHLLIASLYGAIKNIFGYTCSVIRII